MAQRVGCMHDTVLFAVHLAYTYITAFDARWASKLTKLKEDSK